jgi:hypothetical protein
MANAILLSGHTGRDVSVPVNRRAFDRLLATLRERGRDPVKAGADLKITDPSFGKKGSA